MNVPYTESPERLATVRFGMWLFLASEAMFFTALFVMAFIMRLVHPELLTPRPLPWGGALLGALLMAAGLGALASALARVRAGKGAVGPILVALGSGALFIVTAAAGWMGQAGQGRLPSTNIFYGCYYVLTGFEALHVLIGTGVAAVMAWRAKRGDFHPGYDSPLLVTALYWGLLTAVRFIILILLYA